MSIAHITALASAAGVTLKEMNVDADSVDGEIVAHYDSKQHNRLPEIKFQLKSTTSATVSNGIITYR